MRTKGNIIIYIDGYWIDNKRKITGAKCVLGEWQGNDDDWDIFHYFDDIDDIESYMDKSLAGSEFVVTKYYK